MAIQGLRDTSNFVTDQRPKNWRAGILLFYPNGNMPLFALTAAMKSRSVDDPEFNWWDKLMDTQRVALGADIGTGTVNWTLTAGGLKLKEGDILYSEENGEIVRVAADPGSDTAITVARAQSGTTATAITYNGNGVNPNFLKIGSAYEEASLAPSGISFDPTKRYNYTQIFRDTLEASRTAMKTRLRTGDAVKEAKRECLEYHSAGIERSMWLGKRYEGTKNGKPYRTMGGVISQVDSNNVVDVHSAYSSGLTMLGLEEYMYNMFKYGSNEKMAFCGNRSLLTLQQVVRKNTAFTFMTSEKEYGMNVSRLTCPYGTLVLKNHPLFNQIVGGTTGSADYYGMESWLVALDMSALQYVYLQDSDTQYQPNLQQNGLDGLQSGYLTECSVELHEPKAHYVMKNVVSAAADA